MLEALDLYLVNMPLDSYCSPSIGLGLLKAAAEKNYIKTKVLYANLIFADYMGIDEYKKLHNYALSMMLFVESLFQPYAGYKEYASLDEILDHYLKNDPRIEKQLNEYRYYTEQVWSFMNDYLEDVAERIISRHPKAVGCTYTMQQCNANLAILKKIKEKRPDIVTFIGGSACSVYAGQALVDHMDQVDYAFTGESDDIFCDAVRLMIDRRDEELRDRHPWVLQKGGSGQSHGLQDMESTDYPDYDDYFAMLKELNLEGRFKVILPIEGSRGCWWGCMKRCNFCGLNHSSETVSYREKTTKKVAEELQYMSQKYGVYKFGFTDCILSRKQIREFPGLLAGKGYKLFAEVKTNMTFEELIGLRRAGFLWLQPGLEAINDELLTHMNKGNRGIKHIEFLKRSKILGIGIFWNLLRGFPGERDEWYHETIDSMAYISHLAVPSSGIFQYQRQSYFTIACADYGVRVIKETFYPYLFGKDDDFHEAFAEYYYDPCREMHYADPLRKALYDWAVAASRGADLVYFVQNGFLGIHDTRPCAKERKVVLYGLEKRICAYRC